MISGRKGRRNRSEFVKIRQHCRSAISNRPLRCDETHSARKRCTPGLGIKCRRLRSPKRLESDQLALLVRLLHSQPCIGRAFRLEIRRCSISRPLLEGLSLRLLARTIPIRRQSSHTTYVDGSGSAAGCIEGGTKCATDLEKIISTQFRDVDALDALSAIRKRSSLRRTLSQSTPFTRFPLNPSIRGSTLRNVQNPCRSLIEQVSVSLGCNSYCRESTHLSLDSRRELIGGLLVDLGGLMRVCRVAAEELVRLRCGLRVGNRRVMTFRLQMLPASGGDVLGGSVVIPCHFAVVMGELAGRKSATRKCESTCRFHSFDHSLSNALPCSTRLARWHCI